MRTDILYGRTTSTRLYHGDDWKKRCALGKSLRGLRRHRGCRSVLDLRNRVDLVTYYTRLILSQCGQTTSLACNISCPPFKNTAPADAKAIEHVNRYIGFMRPVRPIFKQGAVVAGLGPAASAVSRNAMRASDRECAVRTQATDHENRGFGTQAGELPGRTDLAGRQRALDATEAA